MAQESPLRSSESRMERELAKHCERMGHDKYYEPSESLTTDSTTRAWICAICGLEGHDPYSYRRVESSYEILKRRWAALERDEGVG